jgi:hypothetical protein
MRYADEFVDKPDGVAEIVEEDLAVAREIELRKQDRYEVITDHHQAEAVTFLQAPNLIRILGVPFRARGKDGGSFERRRPHLEEVGEFHDRSPAAFRVKKCPSIAIAEEERLNVFDARPPRRCELCPEPLKRQDGGAARPSDIEQTPIQPAEHLFDWRP